MMTLSKLHAVEGATGANQTGTVTASMTATTATATRDDDNNGYNGNKHDDKDHYGGGTVTGERAISGKTILRGLNTSTPRLLPPLPSVLPSKHTFLAALH